MQISKYLLAASIFAAGLTPLIGQIASEDQEDRNQAREELNRKMAELEAQLQATEEPKPLAEEEAPKIVEKPVEVPKIAVEPVVVKPVEAERPVIPLPVEPKPVEIVTPVVKSPAATYPPIATKDALERARQEMRRKVAELDAQERAPAPKPMATAGTPKTESKVSPPAPAKTTTTVTIPKTNAVATAKSLIPLGVDSEAISRARAETRRKIAELDAQEKMGRRPVAATNSSIAKPVTPIKPVTPAKDQAFTSTIKSSPQSVTSAPAAPTTKSDARKEAEAQAIKAAASKVAPGVTTATSLMQAPPPAVSAAKQARLSELLGRYRADKITPEQYHAERARILAE